MIRYPKNTPTSVEHFKNCGWEAALGNASQEDYPSMWQVLSDTARDAVEAERPSEGRVLWLLADSCSMMLKPSSLNEPFAPYMVMDGKRSALPEDFQSDDVALFTNIYSDISDSKLCARISDLVWLLANPKDPNSALSAIDNYIKVEITTDSWVRDGRECWDRAIQLCLLLRTTSGKRCLEIEQSLVNKLKDAEKTDGYLALWLADLLAKHKLGGNDRVPISEKLESLAKLFDVEGDLHRARDFFDIASEWYRKSGNEEKSSEMIVHCAECWVRDAVARSASDSPSYMVAASFFENAIQKYRSVPKSQRNTHNVDERISQLRDKMNVAGERSLKEMGVFSSEPIDISELVNNARESVRGKPLEAAMFALANVYRGAQVNKIRQFSEENLSKYPFQAMLSATHLSRDGRVVAKQPGVDLGGKSNEATIWPQMVRHYVIEIGIVVQGDIWPALEVVRQEHRIKETDFLTIARHSPIVPNSRESLVAKALYSGYDNDFVTAIHILIPQLENLVRYHLKQVGVKTTNLDSSGIENEKGLSSLMDNEETKEIFGKDLAFEIKALFCDSFGPNLRNELAHGLIGDEDSQSIYSIYAWWLFLRIVFNTFWNATYKEQVQSLVNGEVNDDRV